MVWSDQSFTARLAQHDAVLGEGVTKKSKHFSPNSGLSRKLFLGTHSQPPKQYQAYLGIKFREAAK